MKPITCVAARCFACRSAGPIPGVHCLLAQGSLPSEHGSLPPNPYAEPTLSLGRGGLGSGSGGYEPTMTISTKAAFHAINAMFKVGSRNWA